MTDWEGMILARQEALELYEDDPDEMELLLPEDLLRHFAGLLEDDDDL